MYITASCYKNSFFDAPIQSGCWGIGKGMGWDGGMNVSGLIVQKDWLPAWPTSFAPWVLLLTSSKLL
jgi:hypothetical protein